MEYSPKKMIEALSENDFRLKKKFGQNFIVDKNTILSIVRHADIDSDTLVIEIGPGAGSLTSELCKVAKNVLCYEIDIDIKPILESNVNLENTKIIYDDFLKRDIKSDLKEFDYKKLYVVANLPYYVTTPIIISLIEKKLDVDKIVVMVQKEVGNRFKAVPGTKDYGSLSVYLNYYFSIKKMMDISRNIFIPKPNVDSIVVGFTKKDKVKLENEEIFFKLVRDSFKFKRKTIRNNLKQYDLVRVEEVLEKYGYNLSVRAEQLELNVFVDIANRICK